MKIMHSFFIAISTYSKIPVPQFEWREEDMRYVMCFFPFVGIVIGAVFYGWMYLCQRFGIGNFCRTTVGIAIPLLISGGIHVDGFMDSMDAFSSYRSKEEKLRILKDAHIGAFAVITLLGFGLLYAGALSEISDLRLVAVLAFGFVFARILSGLGVVTLKKAKKEGMLATSSDYAKTKVVRFWLIIEGILCMAAMLFCDLRYGICLVVAAIVTFFYYDWKTKKEFGGISGDTAGYFLTLCEGVMMIVAFVAQLVLG